MKYKRKRQSRAERTKRVRERAIDYELPLCAPFADKPKSWWAGVIDDYIEATKRDSTGSG